MITLIEGMSITYEGMAGVISFVGSSYVVMSIFSLTNQSARLLIYSENYSKIETCEK